MKENQVKGLACQIMDLSEQAMIVICKSNYSVVYANAKARAIFGEDVAGITCYRMVEGEDTPCKACPFQMNEMNAEQIVERYLRSFDQTVQIKVTPLVWEDGEDTLVYTILDSDELLLAKMNLEAKVQSCE